MKKPTTGGVYGKKVVVILHFPPRLAIWIENHGLHTEILSHFDANSECPIEKADIVFENFLSPNFRIFAKKCYGKSKPSYTQKTGVVSEEEISFRGKNLTFISEVWLLAKLLWNQCKKIPFLENCWFLNRIRLGAKNWLFYCSINSSFCEERKYLLEKSAFNHLKVTLVKIGGRKVSW